jgi:transcriptional regulator GlxA family with amidase domain
MQNSPKSTPQPARYDILLFDQFSNHCLANTVEPLRAANTLAQQALYAWRFCTVHGQMVTSSSGLQISPHLALAEAEGHMLIVMPSYKVRAIDNSASVRALRQAAARYDVLTGMDTGSWLMARAGLLNGHRATIHWDEFQSFAEAFADVEAVQERYVVDRNRITCSGAMAAFDLMLDLIRDAHSPLLAMQVAQLFMRDDVIPHLRQMSPRAGRVVARLTALMQSNLDQPLTIPVLAKKVGCTQKLLERATQEAMQTTPQALYQRLRLNHALGLVRETDQSIAEIAARCGYDNAGAMTRAFRKVFGQSPSNVRRGF